MKKIFINLIILIILIILVSIFSFTTISAAEVATTVNSGSTTGITTGSGTAETGEVTTIIAGEQTQNIGKQVLKYGKPEDVQLTGGKFEYKEKEGGKFTATEKSIDGKTDLSDKTDFKSKGNEVSKAKDGSATEIDNKGHITALDVTGKKPNKLGEETKVKISGKTKDTELQIPEGSIIKNNPKLSEKEKAPVYDVSLKEGTQLEKPKLTKKEKADEEAENPYFRFNGISIGLSDQMAEQLGLQRSSRFTGTLAMDGNGNWLTDKGNNGIIFLGADGKTPVVRIPDLASKYTNMNERTYIFNKEDWIGEQGKIFRDSGGGSAVVMDAKSKFIASLITNDKLGQYIELSEGNPFNSYRSAIMPDKFSEVSVSGRDVKIKGDGIAYFGEGVGFRKKGNELFFEKGAKIESIFGQETTQKFGLKFDMSESYNADVYSLDKNGQPLADQRRNLLVRSSISDSGAITNQVVTLDKNRAPIENSLDSRVQQNIPPKDSKGKDKGLLDGIIGAMTGKDVKISPEAINIPVTSPATPPITIPIQPLKPPVTPPTHPEPSKTPNTAYQTSPYKYQLHNPGQANHGTVYDFSSIAQTYANGYNPRTHSKGAFIKVGAEWCPGCVATNGAFDSLGQQYSGRAYFSHLDVTNSNDPQVQTLLKQAGLSRRAIPYIIHLDNGNVQLLTPQGNSATSVIDQLRQRLR